MTHNPEFTTCEFYWAYQDYNDLMEFTEELLSKMVLSIKGSYKFKYHPGNDPNDPNKEIEIDFTPPFRRVPMMKGLEEKLRTIDPTITFPANDTLHTEETRLYFDNLCKTLKVECANPRSAARLIDKLVGDYLESECVTHPTFIIDHPVIMSPLAKWHRSEKGLTERFEMFCICHEFLNAYTELNDPKVQLASFQQQAGAKDDGDDEA